MLGKQIIVFITKIDEYGRKPEQPMHRHVKNWSYFQELGQLCSLPCDSETVDIDLKQHLTNAVLINCRIIDQASKKLDFLNSSFNRFDSHLVFLVTGCSFMLCNILIQ